jgi:hypothetical protein
MSYRYLVFLGGLLGALLLGGLPASAQAQATATLRVLVVSAADGAPLEGANVVLTAPDGSTVQAGVANRDGYYEMRGVAPGRYQLAVSFVGFETHRDTLTLEEGQRVYSVSLSIRTGQIEEVTVETERGAAQRQAGRQTIQAAEIGRVPSPGPGGDLASYLQTLPGVVSVGDRGGQFYIRGGAPTQNRYLVDGFPIVQPFHISSFYSAFPQNTIQSADLYAGGFGAEYAEATSSVLDVRLRPGNMKRYGGSAAVGPHLAALQVEGPIVRGEQSFLASARYSLIEQTAGPLLGQEAPIGFYDVTGRYTYQRDNASCHVTALLTHDEGSINPDRNRAFAWSNTVVGGRCLILAEQFDHTFSVRGGYSGFQNRVGTVGGPGQRAGRWRAFLALNYDQTLLGQPIDFGGRVTAGSYSAVINERFTDLERINEAQGMVRVHWSMDWGLGDFLTLEPSIAGQVTYAVRLSVDPRLRLSLRPWGSDDQEISLAAGVYHQIDEGVSDQRDAGSVFTVWRPPQFDDPLPQSLQAIVGYRHRFTPSLEVSVEGYGKRLRNFPVAEWQPEVGVSTGTALANGTAYGADARVEYQRGPFYGFVGYGWSTVNYRAATDDLGAWIDGTVFSYSPPHDRRHQVNIVSSYEFWGATASVSWEFGTGRPYTRVYGFDLSLDVPNDDPLTTPGTARTIYQRPYDARLPAYHRLDVSLSRSFALSSRLALDAEVGAINVYDRPNIFYYDADTLQRVDQSPLLPYFSLKLSVD